MNQNFRWLKRERALTTVKAVQPLFALPVYFSALTGSPPIWAGVAISLVPLGIRFWLNRSFVSRSPFDLPILLFLSGMLVGFFVAPDKSVAAGALATTLGSIAIYYGIIGNSEAKDKHWLYAAGIICLFVFAASVWFFSQDNVRILPYNAWAFRLFRWLPRTGISLQWHSVGSVLAVIVPPLLSVSLFNGRLWLRLVCLAIGFVFLAALALSTSGTGWIAVICGLTFVILCWKPWAVSVIAPVAGIVVTATAAQYSKTRWLYESLSTSTLLDRLQIWLNTVAMVRGWHMLAGLGIFGYYSLYENLYGRTVGHVHNNYLQVFCDTGILGMAAMIAAYVVFVRMATEIVRSSRLGRWHGAAVGLTGSIIAGAVFAFLDVTTNGVLVTPKGFIYISVPVLWIWAALFVIAYGKLQNAPK